MIKSTVAVLKTTPETVISDITRLMDLAAVSTHLDAQSPTIIKDNISWHKPFLSANTTPWQLEGVIQGLQRMGYTELTAVHNDTVVTNPFKGGRLNRLTPVYREHRIPQLFNFRPQDIQWVRYTPRARMRALDKLFPAGIHLPEYFFGKNIVHLPTVKCHIYTTTTGAIKNAFGGLLTTQRHYAHSHIHEILVDLLAIQKEIHSGLFAVTDGTLAGNGPGPRTMRPVQKDFLLASGDQVAIDAVAARMMGFDPMRLDYIRLAHEDGLGTGRIEDIDVIGTEISDQNWAFSVGNNMAGKIGHLCWFSPLKVLQRLFFRTPLVYLFIIGSFLYHDYLWWPTLGKKRMRRVAATSWGRLFMTYPEG